MQKRPRRAGADVWGRFERLVKELLQEETLPAEDRFDGLILAMRATGCHAIRSASRRSGSSGWSASLPASGLAKSLEPSFLFGLFKTFHAILNHPGDHLRDAGNRCGALSARLRRFLHCRTPLPMEKVQAN